jgi:proteasome accessory factor A
METEYATLVATEDPTGDLELPSSHSIYLAICDAIRKDQPTGAGIYDTEQMFLASGGAVTFESHPTLHALPGGLIEIATPEVRSPDELLACQRSIDALIADAAQNVQLDVDLRVLKNSTDAFGHVYGCQENYEAVVARGIWLPIYWLFVAALWVVQIACLIASLPVLAGLYVAGALYRLRSGKRKTSQSSQDDSDSLDDAFQEAPGWITGLVVVLFRMIHFPTVLILKFLVKYVAFRQQRKYLNAFLYSRVALCGSGVLNLDGCFHLSAKAMAIDTNSDLGGFRGERPVFVHGHWLTQFCAKSFLSLSSTRSMFRRHQRLQIGLSDSNMSDLAEFAKVGSTSLLLDMIEAGATEGLPTVSRSIKPLLHLTSDWNLVARIQTSQGKLSALEIQNKYLRAARQFVHQVDVSQQGEAPLVLQRWGKLYDAVHAFRRDASEVKPSLGQVDWLTKRWLMGQLGDEGDWSRRKKIDLRYHELSREGYYYQLAQNDPQLRLISPQRIERRRRLPPPDSPAARRGWLIREFSSSDEHPQFDWSHAMIGKGTNRRRIEFQQDPT